MYPLFLEDFMFCDFHVHTYYSDDSIYPMEDVIKDAINLKMNEICFTDHVDYGVKNDVGHHEINTDKTNVDYQKYFKEIEYLQRKYPTISIKKGLEFGIQKHTISKFQKLFDTYPMDFVILSCHQVDDLEFWTQDYQRNKTQEEYNMGYFKEILDVIKVYKDYSILGHLDHMVRYDKLGEYPFEKIKDIVKEILEIAIQDGKGIELNTSYVRYGLNDVTPSRDILKLYYDIGGKIITIGSDSHRKDHLGKYIEENKQILKEIGFKEFCTFEKMKPIFWEL